LTALAIALAVYLGIAFLMTSDGLLPWKVALAWPVMAIAICVFLLWELAVALWELGVALTRIWRAR
jgi:uncharacterized membrane protein